MEKQKEKGEKNRYDHKKIEKKWQKFWEENETFKTREDKGKDKFYILDMFPYPSGAGLHVGHPKGYIATDVFAHMKRLQGFNVLHPMGWDAFGLPAENFALKNKTHPAGTTEKNVATFKNQLKKIGLSYDWSREINTTDPEFYKWTQWAFIQMFKKGLAYQSDEPIIWCPSCQTGLAMEDLEDGKCERCGSEVERKPMRQWVLKITDYADRMLDDLEKISNWDESIREMQRNWIGRSEGAEVEFSISNSQFSIKVFTTRPDTLFGCTYLVLSPEHPLIEKLKDRIKNYSEVKEYVKQAGKKSDLERTDLNKDKTGVRLEGVMAVNPVNGEEVPIFVADYVLANYGTGAIMAVPAHDERDYEFAKKYDLEIRKVVLPEALDHIPRSAKDLASGLKSEVRVESDCFADEGENINSGFLDGMKTAEAKEKMIEWLEEKGVGKRQKNYRLNDWVFSRQRYWGEPIPMVHCKSCGLKKNKFKVLMIHGFEANGEMHWFLWFKEKLEKIGCEVFAPTLKTGSHPGINETVEELRPYFDKLDENSFVIGHSMGGKLAVHLLEKYEKKIKGLFLVAPIFGECKITPEEFNKKAPNADLEALIKFWKTEIDWEKVKNKFDFASTIISDDDEYIRTDHHKAIKIENLEVQEWQGQGHFTKNEKEEKLGKYVTKKILEKVDPVAVPVPEEDLPVELPHVEKYEPTGTGESPLANIDEWVNTTCPECGGPAKRETNTMPQWAGSSWYYLRYIDPKNSEALVDKKKEKYWSPVDFYVGGAEHATRHLIYARFWHKFLFDIGVVTYDEPFTRLQHVGLVMAEDGRKMGKRWGNVINPDDVIEEHGADAMRVYEMFMGPFSQACDWSTNGLIGARKFLEKVQGLTDKIVNEDSKEVGVMLHKTIKKVGEDVEGFKFNTAIAQMMIFVNKVSEVGKINKENLEKFIIVLAPFAPHLCEEIWNKLGNKKSIFKESWPEFDEKLIQDEKIELVVQVNGKVRGRLNVSADISEDEVKKVAMENENVKKFIEGKEVKKAIYVPGKILNIVV